MKVLLFTGISKLLKESREKTPWSQTDLAKKLNMRNGQFISNIERGLCGLPSKYGSQVCDILSIDKDVMIETMTADYKNGLIEDFNSGNSGVQHGN